MLDGNQAPDNHREREGGSRFTFLLMHTACHTIKVNQVSENTVKEIWSFSACPTLHAWFREHALAAIGKRAISRLVSEALELYPALGADTVDALRKKARAEGVSMATLLARLIRKAMDGD